MATRLLKVRNYESLDENLLGKLEKVEPVPGERNLKPVRVRTIARRLLSGTYNRCEWATCHCVEDGVTYRVNGQHTSHALRKLLQGALKVGKDTVSPDRFPDNIPVTWQEWECDSTEELADVFDQFDNHGSSRSAEDKLGIYISKHDDLTGLDKVFIRRMLAGVVYANKHVTKKLGKMFGRIHIDCAHDRGKLLDVDEVREFICVLADYKSGPFDKWETVPGIVAAFFVEFIKEGEEMTCRVLDGTVNMVGQESKKYAMDMAQNVSRKGRDSGWYFRKTASYIKAMNALLSNLDNA